jgi:hypothetical protein
MKNHLRHLLLKAEVRKVLSGGDMRFGGTDVAFKRKKEKKKILSPVLAPLFQQQEFSAFFYLAEARDDDIDLKKNPV